jgi:uncharacterized protein YbaP (TraB family)
MNKILRPLKSRGLLLSLCVVITLCAQNTVFAKSFLWQIQSPTTTVYLLGSIHFATPEIYPLDNTIESAFDRSSVLVVELDDSQIDQDTIRQYIVDNGIYPENDTIKNHIDKDTMQTLENYLNQYRMPVQGFVNMKPGFLAMTLTVAHIVRLGYLPQYGIDKYFLNKAQNKKILQLETAEQQLSLFFEIPKEELFLKHTLNQLQSLDGEIDDIVNAWRRGDVAALERFLLDDPMHEYPELELVYDSMYTQRNIRMAAHIEKFLKDKEPYFVVVGAGHLVGQQGIVTLLSGKGYKITQK